MKALELAEQMLALPLDQAVLRSSESGGVDMIAIQFNLDKFHCALDSVADRRQFLVADNSTVWAWFHRERSLEGNSRSRCMLCRRLRAKPRLTVPLIRRWRMT